MKELFVTKDSMSDQEMTVFIKKRVKGVDIVTIDGKYSSIEQFNKKWELLISLGDFKYANFIPLTRDGATQLRDALTKALEDEG